MERHISARDDFDRIADALNRIGRYTAGLEAEEFQQDAMVQDAVLYNLEQISARAQRIPTAWRESHAQLPWDQLDQLASQVIADNDSLPAETIWLVIQNDLPPLVEPIANVLNENE